MSRTNDLGKIGVQGYSVRRLFKDTSDLRSALARGLSRAVTLDDLAGAGCPWQDRSMMPNTLSELLKLSAGERAELAMALWESLSDSEREAELALTAEQKAEL